MNLEGLEFEDRIVNRSPQRWPSRKGAGFMYQYFDGDGPIEDILVGAQTLALAHCCHPPRQLTCLPERTQKIVFLMQREPEISWWPRNEALGLFLLSRATSRAGLVEATNWFVLATRNYLKTSVESRIQERARFLGQEEVAALYWVRLLGV